MSSDGSLVVGPLHEALEVYHPLISCYVSCHTLLTISTHEFNNVEERFTSCVRIKHRRLENVSGIIILDLVCYYK